MAFLAALVAFGSRFASKVLTTSLGWASTLLFGRVPASRQLILLAITFGSVIWLVMVAGLIVPDVGAFLLLLVPPQNVVPQGVIRALMLIGVLVVPAIVGLLTLALVQKDQAFGRRLFESVARGYPLTIMLAILLIFLALLAIWRKGMSLARRWTDAHVPMVVKPGAYEKVADDLDRALTDVGFDLEATAAPATMSVPAKWLAAVAGRSSAGLVPDRMVELRGPGLDILIYPMDILISGKADDVARARAAMASRLTTSAAHLTVSAEAQEIEDRLTALGTGRLVDAGQAPRFDDAAAAEFGAIDKSLATIRIPYEEWEVLYRQRLQVERDLRAGAMAGEAVVGAATPGAATPGAATPGAATPGAERQTPRLATVGRSIGRLLRRGAALVVYGATGVALAALGGDSATDRRTGPEAAMAAGEPARLPVESAQGG